MTTWVDLSGAACVVEAASCFVESLVAAESDFFLAEPLLAEPLVVVDDVDFLSLARSPRYFTCAVVKTGCD